MVCNPEISDSGALANFGLLHGGEIKSAFARHGERNWGRGPNMLQLSKLAHVVSIHAMIGLMSEPRYHLSKAIQIITKHLIIRSKL